MAMMKCPECGNDVSDKAKTCIHCGFPISSLTPIQGTAIIKVGKLDTTNLWAKATIIDADTGAEIAKVRQGESFTIKVDKAMNIKVKFGPMMKAATATLNPNERVKYLLDRQTFSLFLTKIDVIDSD